MTAPFDWAGLTDELNQCDSYVQVVTHLRTRIEAAFVPVEDHDERVRVLQEHMMDERDLRVAATARIEAAEARMKVLEELISELSDDLEAEVQDRWGYDDRLSHKLKRDMDVVVRARKALGGEHE